VDEMRETMCCHQRTTLEDVVSALSEDVFGASRQRPPDISIPAV
jgi:hypothetical protein